MAKGSILVFYPADLQFNPNDIPILVQPLLNGYDISTGWKQGKYEKQFISSIYNFLSRKLFNLDVHDLNSVKAFKSDVVKDISLRYNWHRYLVALANNHDNPNNYKIKEVKIPLYPRNWGKSKFGVKRIPGGVFDLIAVKTNLSLLRKPMSFFGTIGSMFIFLGIMIGIYSIYKKYFMHDAFGPILYCVVILIGIGIALFIFGILAEGIITNREKLITINRKIDSMKKQLNEISERFG